MAAKRRDGTGSIFQRKSGQWVAQIRVYDDLEGKSKVIRRNAKNRADARDLLKELRTQPVKVTQRGGITLADYLETWTTENLPHSDVAPSTKVKYAEVIKWYAIPAAGQIQLTKFGPTQAEQWVARLRDIKKRNGEPLAPSTVRKVYNAALKALDTAVRDGEIVENPLRRIDRPTAPKVAVPVTKADEVERLLERLNGEHLKPPRPLRIKPLVTFVAFTGCRIGEALSLRWEDVDLDDSTATIRRGSLERETTKTGKVRTVTLLPEVVDQLRIRRKTQREERLLMGIGWQNDQNLVFTTGEGRPVDRLNATRDLRRELDATGITMSRPWHSLRHGLAHRLLARGVPLVMVSAILGHSGIQITSDTYGHLEATIPVDVLAEALGR